MKSILKWSNNEAPEKVNNNQSKNERDLNNREIV